MTRGCWGGRERLEVLGRAGLAGPGMAVHPGTGAPLPRVQFQILVSESLPYLPFPSVHTHLRHLSSARPLPAHRGWGVGPRSLCGGLSPWFPWGVSGLLAPLGAKSLLLPLCFPLLSIHGPRTSAPGQPNWPLAPGSPPHPSVGRSGSGMALHIHFVSALPPPPSGRKLRPAGGQGTS